jgi:hypothetical protein
MRTLLKGWRRRLAVILLAVALILAGVVVTLLRDDNRVYKSLDALSKISFGDRWEHPEMLKIRALGPKAMPDLRRVLKRKGKSSHKISSVDRKQVARRDEVRPEFS